MSSKTKTNTPSADGSRSMLLDDREHVCWVSYEPHFLSESEADALFSKLSAIPFTAEAPVMFGKAVEVKRRSTSFGDPGTRYRYAGLERVAEPWPEFLRSPTLERLQQRLGVHFTYVLCNLYPDGKAGLGWHSDDEADLVPEAPIASISLGAARDFLMRRGTSGKSCLDVTLGHGSLLVMGGRTQRHYQHRVPTRARCTEPRINLTFRMMR
jgi:alkylated DNA repair dioxygenase AlkB